MLSHDWSLEAQLPWRNLWITWENLEINRQMYDCVHLGSTLDALPVSCSFYWDQHEGGIGSSSLLYQNPMLYPLSAEPPHSRNITFVLTCYNLVKAELMAELLYIFCFTTINLVFSQTDEESISVKGTVGSFRAEPPTSSVCPASNSLVTTSLQLHWLHYWLV